MPGTGLETSRTCEEPTVKDMMKKGTKTMWVTVFKCFHCGKPGHKLPKCRQCSQAYYCNADCQHKHWKRHKPVCRAAVVTLARHAHRQRVARAVREKGKETVEHSEDDDLCVICQDTTVDPVEVRFGNTLYQNNPKMIPKVDSEALSLTQVAIGNKSERQSTVLTIPLHLASRQLPCGHEYCKACVEELRQKGVDKSCPLCRKPLPPGPDKLFDLGYRVYMNVFNAVNRSRPGDDPRKPWPILSAKPQREMNHAVAMIREAADQGHMTAQAWCGDAHGFGHGVAKDERLAFVYNEKAAIQGHMKSQFNTGCRYQDGRGCEQSYEKSIEWLEKAAHQGFLGAYHELGRLHTFGRGVPRNHPRAVELWQYAASKGVRESQDMLAQCYEHAHGVPKNYAEARRLYSLAFAQGLAPDHLKQLEDKIRIECPLLGMPVVIVGTSREDLNGQVGLAQSFDEALGRYVVKLDAPLTVSPTLKLKPGNLVPVPRT